MNETDYVVKVLNYSRDGNISDDSVDVVVHFGDGSRYSATFFTVENIRSLLKSYRASGECASGKYLWAANMIVIESLDLSTIEVAVADLIRTGEFTRAFDGPHIE